MGKHVLITGATGMVGGLVLTLCLESREVSRVTSLLRRKSGIRHEKLTKIIIQDFSVLDENADCFEAVDIVYYCLGVYTGAVDRVLFRKITVDYPETLARAVLAKNSEVTFCLLSGAGADRTEKSRMMFSQDKGAVENRLSRMGFRAFHAFRPGYIYPVTPRNEPNVTYRLMRRLYPVLNMLAPRFSITSTDLAAAIFTVGMKGYELEILENRDILKVIGRA
ncbi:MAG: NAD-dependent epimerase/dehydratase family protein [Deltaproteobacteria bacterium]|nr:NAD-dependent epimerase/dehydratase family protein [Candidatus Zymogenaceae bacterium]